MTKNKKWFSRMLWLAAGLAIFAAPRTAFAKDDFGRIVQHIETQYHVHRQHRWVMGLAGFTVRFYHFAGVKQLKGAIFENQRFLDAASDTKFDEAVRAAMDSGWQPMVRSWDRHTGEKTYIYAQSSGKDMKMLVVNLEQNEAVVLQVKVDPEKLNEFVREASAGHNRGKAAREKEAQASQASADTAQGRDCMCLLAREEALVAAEP